MELTRAHAKARSAVKKREENIEQEELESGEINLIPYLDVVTNLMLFILATITTAGVLGMLDTQLPDAASAAAKPNKPGNELDKPWGIKVTITSDNVTIFRGITDRGDGVTSESKPFPMITATKKDGTTERVHDWEAVNTHLADVIVKKGVRGKYRPYNTYKVKLVASNSTPYDVIIQAMDAMRCKIHKKDGKRVKKRCILPKLAEDPKTGKPLEIDGRKVVVSPPLVDGHKPVEIKAYDPDTMALFHLVGFSKLVGK